MKRAAPAPVFNAADARFMRRALALARRGLGTTSPNPMVGAVVVRRGRIIAEGFHRKAGGPHAEIEALRALPAGGARGATLYVTLEPCCHIGRTGPCTTAVLAARPARVVVGCRDPNPIVDGRGLTQLRRAGIRVDVGCLEDEARELIRPYAVWIKEGRPVVTLKAAATLDGCIAAAAGRRGEIAWITGKAARRAAHVLRAAHDAVLVGGGTARADNPQLTVRLGGARRGARQPLRVVLAGKRALPRASHLLDGAAETLVIPGRPSIARVLARLAARGVQSVLVEGGARVHGAFIAAGLVDRVVLFLAPRLLGGGVPIATGGRRAIADALRLGPTAVKRVGEDLMLTADVVRG